MLKKLTKDDFIEENEFYIQPYFERYKGKVVLRFLKSVSIYAANLEASLTLYLLVPPADNLCKQF